MSIWKYPQVKSTLSALNYFTLGEGETEIEPILLNGTTVYLKREDHNPTGSYKDRGTAYKITELLTNGIREGVIASSGNAAISFLTYGSKFGFKVHAVVSNHVNPAKLEKLKSLAGNMHTLHITDTPRRMSAQISAERQIPNLRASVDNTMPIGYRSLGLDLAGQGFTDLFVACSSGTALLGISQGLAGTRIHAAQTSQIHPICGEFQQGWQMDQGNSLADAITDKVAMRKQQIVRIIRDSGGYGWILGNLQIEAAKSQVNSVAKTPIGNTSALAVAAYLKAVEQGQVGTKVVIVTSGN